MTEAAITTAPTDARTANVPAATYAMDSEHSMLEVLVPHNRGLSHYHIRFFRITGELVLDPADPAASSVRIEVDPKSLKTAPVDAYKDYFPESGFESWDEELANKEGFLDALKFPKIVFTSNRVVKTGEFTADIEGTLGFLGLRKPLTMTASYNGGLEQHPFVEAAAVGFSAEGRFRRSTFGMADIGIADETVIRFDGQFIEQIAAA